MKNEIKSGVLPVTCSVLLAVCTLFACSNDADPPRASPIIPPDWLPEGTDLLSLLKNLSIRENPLTFCNPINISYQYQHDFKGRESADPAAIAYNNEYYLFASHGTGYWWSSDLVKWNFVYSAMPEIYKWAPAVCVAGGELYLTHSQEGRLYKSSNPKADSWADIGRPYEWGDPALFTDDDGRVYAYEGLSPTAPIIGMELDPANNMAVIGEPVVLINQHRAARGFENPGDNNETRSGGECWHEGAWMTKNGGKYYLQYAVPGTGFATYADGYYVSDNPLGPFTYADNSPLTFKATGFVRGAGHGSAVKDSSGNWWKFDTVAGVSADKIFERRLIMVPAAFDSDGRFITNMAFSDYPLYAPFSGLGSFSNPCPEWNLLSLDKGGKASSALAGRPLSAAFDENIRTWWSAETGDEGEWITADLGRLCAINAVQINFADQDIALNPNKRNHHYVYRYLLEFSLDGKKWYSAVDRSNAVAGPNTAKDTSHDYFEFDNTAGEPVARYLRLTNKGPVPADGKFAVSGLRVFGRDGSGKPGNVSGLKASRPQSEERSVTVSWNAAEGAEGYMVLWGALGSSLPLHYQVIGKTQCVINALNMGVDYEFAVFAYGPGGIGERSGIVTAIHTKPVPEPPIPPEPVPAVAGYAVYEAESATIGNGAVVGSANEIASGGKILQNMHNTGAYFELKNVDGGPGGSATVRLVYSNGESSATKTGFTLNGVFIREFAVPSTGGWNNFTAIENVVNGFTAGATNTLRFEGRGAGFNPDYVQVIY